MKLLRLFQIVLSNSYRIDVQRKILRQFHSNSFYHSFTEMENPILPHFVFSLPHSVKKIALETFLRFNQNGLRQHFEIWAADIEIIVKQVLSRFVSLT